MRIALLFSIPALIWVEAIGAQTLTLEQAMADPDWIGREPRNPYWADDSQSLYFSQKRLGAEQEDLFESTLDGDISEVLADELAQADTANGILSPNQQLKAYSRAGDLYVRSLPNGEVRQLTRSAEDEAPVQFSADSRKIIFTRDEQQFVRDLETGLEYQAAELLVEDYPGDEDELDYLTAQQSRLFDIIQLQEAREDAAKAFADSNRAADRARLALPYYLGADMEILSSALSPNEAWMLVTLRDSEEREPGRVGSMPNYVTASGYVENREVRSRVGTSDFADQTLILLDLARHEFGVVELDALPTRDLVPLEQQLGEQAPADENGDADESREVYISGLRWSDDGERALFNVISRDNKDRWLLRLDVAALRLPAAGEEELADGSRRGALEFESDHLTLLHHEHDPAWINRGFTGAQWLPDQKSILFHSEQDGYGHLYVEGPGGTRQLTSGQFEVREPRLSRDGSQVYFRANATHPTVYEIFRATLSTGELEQLTRLGGMNRFQLAPDESRLLIQHSTALHPPELYVQDAAPNAVARRLTHTVSDDFLAIDWAQPAFVEVPSSHVQQPIHSRLYMPPGDSDAPRPAVVFIHGAGYLQNAHQGWSGYFREFMFHSFLVQQGYVVLDMDYRASLGYGRDWRTAIYRQMGTPEVQDLADGVDWLVEHQGVDRQRICTYGGSYGGFLTLMALFNEPELFACGAALRPVTDWAHYNHGYTSNILNIPELDPEAYERSSPIEFAGGLEKPLLIAHGMQDDNVFFQDSVRLVQRLIELGKEDWEMAIYPIEAHGFREPSSWLDEYRRIYKIVEETVNP